MSTFFREMMHRFQYIRKHVLGINYRNSEYIFKHNPKKLFPYVDDKILTKTALEPYKIPVPEMYFAVKSYFDLRTLNENLESLDTFVIKPTNGFGGEGVIIVTENLKNGTYRLADDSIMPYKKLRAHVQEILAGVYSLNQMPDTAICEYKINGHRGVMQLSYKGIPDIRILLFRGVPIMAMLRLSTKRSKGKANLHQGGIGVGIDLSTGITKHALYSNTHIADHPDNQMHLIGYQIPDWDELLRISVECYQAVPLGYLGVDLVIDEKLGPMVLELNARPGLQLQMANRVGIKQILSDLQSRDLSNLSIHDRICLGQDLYKKACNTAAAF